MLVLFERTGFTGLNCFMADYYAGHFDRVLTIGWSGLEPTITSWVNTQLFSQIAQMIEMCCEYLSVWCI